MVQKYINIKHEYGSFDCIELIKQLYANELNIDFSIPAYPKSREWMKYFTSKSVDDWASVYGEKVKLTEAKNYDVIIFVNSSSPFTALGVSFIFSFQGLERIKFNRPEYKAHRDFTPITCVDDSCLR